MLFKISLLAFTFVLQMSVGSTAFSDDASAVGMRYLSTASYAAVKATIPPFPVTGSVAEQNDIETILALQNSRTSADCQRANAIVQISLASFFGAPYGMLSDDQITLLTPLFNQVRVDIAPFVNGLKADFGRLRPYDYIPGVQPCVPKDPSLSYPSGHTTTAFIEASVLAQLYPQLADRLMARAGQIGEDRVVGGVHHPTDIQAGEWLAQQLFALMKASPVFQSDLQTLRAYIK